jgi:hypothetical protein
MTATAPEYLTTIRDSVADAVQQWVDQSATAWDQWVGAWTPVAEAGASAVGASLRMPGANPALRPRHRGHNHGEEDCGCGDSGHGCREHHDHGERHHPHHHGERECGCHDHSHGCCPDACDCCVPEADVVVRARAGELRVVPFRLHNPWRREREVTLEVGPWHVCAGDGVEVRARLEEASLVLKPCEDRVVRLLVTATGTTDDGEQAGDEKATPAKAVRAAEREEQSRVVTRRGGDVDSCASAYADLRFEGCARPQRVAVVVLPADCDPVEVGCDCGCCAGGHDE